MNSGSFLATMASQKQAWTTGYSFLKKQREFYIQSFFQSLLYLCCDKSLLLFPHIVPLRTGSKLGISPLMLAAMNGHTAAVKLLLDMGSDINAQIETNRNTALTLACFQGRTEVVSLLLDRKANVEHRAKVRKMLELCQIFVRSLL